MSIRQQPLQPQFLASRATAVLGDWEMPATQAYSAFSDRLDADLLSLEDRFHAFCTANSIAGSLGR